MTKPTAEAPSVGIFVLQSLRETVACFLFVALSLRLSFGKSCSGAFPVKGQQHLALWSSGKWVEVAHISYTGAPRNWLDSCSAQHTCTTFLQSSNSLIHHCTRRSPLGLESIALSWVGKVPPKKMQWLTQEQTLTGDRDFLPQHKSKR